MQHYPPSYLAAALQVAQRGARLLCRTRLNRDWRDIAILAADVAGYSRLMGVDGEAFQLAAEFVLPPDHPTGVLGRALRRAWRKVEKGMVGFVNVKPDYRARATTALV